VCRVLSAATSAVQVLYWYYRYYLVLQVQLVVLACTSSSTTVGHAYMRCSPESRVHNAAG
jgi:hypothetical protein